MTWPRTLALDDLSLCALAVAVAGATIPDSSGAIDGYFGNGGVLRVIES